MSDNKAYKIAKSFSYLFMLFGFLALLMFCVSILYLFITPFAEQYIIPVIGETFGITFAGFLGSIPFVFVFWLFEKTEEKLETIIKAILILFRKK